VSNVLNRSYSHGRIGGNKALMQTNPPNVNLDNDHASNQEIPEIRELTSGCSSDPYLRPT
jgi:hypothetical protein